jgi:hypothetical protein
VVSDALLTWWHQALDLSQEITTDNANAILVSSQNLLDGTSCKINREGNEA